MKKNLKGRMSIGRRQGGDADQFIFIELFDDNSGLIVTQVKIALANFAQCITGLSLMDCEFDLNTTDIIGKQREIKMEQMEFPYQPKYEDIIRASKALELDGWQCNESPHTRIDKKQKGDKWFVNVHFKRYVEIEKELS